MAFTEFATGDAQAVKRWSDRAFVETFGKMGLRGLVGKSNTYAIQLKTELDADAGDEIRFDLRAQNRGAGVNGDTVLDGYEEALQFFQDTVKVNFKRHAHAAKNMSQQRSVHDLREHARDSLTEWFAWFIEAGMFAHLAGTAGDDPESPLAALGATTGQADFAGNTIVALDAGHLVDGTGSGFALTSLDTAVALARTQNPRVAPIKVSGQEVYVAYLHPFQIKSLRTTSTGINWNQIQRDAATRGDSNPIFTGAFGMYNNVVIRESEFVPSVGTVRHGVLLGQGAGVLAFGNAWEQMARSHTDGSFFKLVEQKKDYDHQKGIAATSCLGFKRCQFNAKAFGVIGLRSTDT